MPRRSSAFYAALVVAIAACAAITSCSSDGDTITNVTNVTSVSVYGDGSAGAMTISSDTLLASGNSQYTNFTVDSGVTLTVPSGTVIRCTGTFTNNGTIVVETGAWGSLQNGNTGLLDGTYAPAEPGVSLRAASPGELGDNTVTRAGGLGGVALNAAQARSTVRPGVKAGGGAGGSYARDGANGGGSLVIRAKASATNAGSITANGESLNNRAGGGGGGIIIVASDGAIDNSGTIAVDGGDGGTGDSFAGPGGGGGGGIIHFMSKSATVGTTSVAGGAAGAAAGPTGSGLRQGGGGGGACGGGGGNGGSVSTAGAHGSASAGAAGHVLTTDANPAALFLTRGLSK